MGFEITNRNYQVDQLEAFAEYEEFKHLVQDYVNECCEKGTEPDLNEFSRMHAVRELSRREENQVETWFVKFTVEWQAANKERVSA